MSFIDLYLSTFPGVSKDTASSLHEHFKNQGLSASWTYQAAVESQSKLWQGDVVSKVPMCMLTSKGDDVEPRILRESSAIIMSNSCDCERVGSLVVIPLVNGDSFLKGCSKDDQDQILHNRHTDKILLPPVSNSSSKLIGVMEFITHTPRELVMSRLAEGRSERLAVLSQEGYYFLLAKLTLHLLRPEALDVPR